MRPVVVSSFAGMGAGIEGGFVTVGEAVGIFYWSAANLDRILGDPESLEGEEDST